MATLERQIPSLIDENEAAKRLGLSPQTLSNWRCTHKVSIPFVRVGRAIRYRVEDISNFIEENLVGAATSK